MSLQNNIVRELEKLDTFLLEFGKLSSTSERYHRAIRFLATYIQNANYKAFVVVFIRYKITIDGIVECFSTKDDQCHAKALFENVCRMISNKLKK